MAKELECRRYDIDLGTWPVRIYPNDDGSFPDGDDLRAEVEERLEESLLLSSPLVLPEELARYTEEYTDGSEVVCDVPQVRE